MLFFDFNKALSEFASNLHYWVFGYVLFAEYALLCFVVKILNFA